MSTNVALTAVPKGATTATKKKREQIGYIETPPKPDWFVSVRERGRLVWYLRFIVTGMVPRRFGPYKNRHHALLALDGMVGRMGDFNCDLHDKADKYLMHRRFHHNWGPVIEDDLALSKGR